MRAVFSLSNKTPFIVEYFGLFSETSIWVILVQSVNGFELIVAILDGMLNPSSSLHPGKVHLPIDSTPSFIITDKMVHLCSSHGALVEL